MYKVVDKIFWQNLWRHELEEMAEKKPVVIVPIGAIEQHGPQCSLDVDISVPLAIAECVARAIDEFPVLVAPPVWWGISHMQMDFIGTITLRVKTLMDLLKDICSSIYAHGFKRMVLLNGHGPNRQVTETVSLDLRRDNIFVAAITYWTFVQEELTEIREADPDTGVGHAGELETSLELYLRPQLVDTGRLVKESMGGWGSFLPGPGQSKGMIYFPYWKHLSFGVHGDARSATPEKGKKVFDAVLKELIAFIREYRDYECFGP